MIKRNGLYFLLGLILFPLSCEAKDPELSVGNFERKSAEPQDGIRIAWDYSTLQRIAPRDGRESGWVGYPRVRRLSNGDVIAVYETGGSVEIKRSIDKGETWSDPSILFDKHYVATGSGEVLVIKANGELLELASGELVAACNYRPAEDGFAPFAIAVKRSVDKGKNWTDPEVIYEGGNTFHDGCWEPSFLQLLSGELQVYFANETPYTSSEEQEISMLRSFDNGKTWTEDPATVCFRQGFRDGMPVPVLSGDQILLAIEDNVDGQFKPWIVSSDASNPWERPVSGNSSFRHPAHQDQLPENVYAGAPYLLKLPDGPCLLSYQTTHGRGPNWELSTMEVAIGDENGRDFSMLSRPFNVPLDREAKWNSLSMWDENTVLAASTTSFHNRNCEVWTILGHVIPELAAKIGFVSVDGQANPGEWTGIFPLFIGHNGGVNMKADIMREEKAVCFAVKIEYSEVDVFSENQKDSGVRIFIDGGNYCLTDPDAGLFSLFLSTEGELKIQEGKDGEWIDADGEAGIETSVERSVSGCFMELKVPLSWIQHVDGSDIRVNMQLTYRDATGKEIVENIANAKQDASHTWCRVRFQ